MKWTLSLIVVCLLSSCKTNNIKKHFSAQLILSDKTFSKIKAKRNKALELDHLYHSSDDYVKGKFIHKGETLNVKTRLKGDHVDHLKGNRWSFRVVSKKPDLFNHYKISIQGLATRSYLQEWVFHKLLKEEGLIHLQYELLEFSVNDTLDGVYVMESHFDNHLLDMSNRPYGPILKFDEENFWNYGLNGWKGFNDDSVMVKSKIKITNKHWLKSNVEHKKLAQQAKEFIDNHRNKKGNIHRDFDLEKWAKFIALNELTGINHSLRWHNLRFYFNPESSKIEPVGFDNGTWFPKDYQMFFKEEHVECFYEELFQDEVFSKLILSEIQRISKTVYLDQFFEKYEPKLDSLVEIVQKEKADYKFWKSSYYKSQKRIKELLN